MMSELSYILPRISASCTVSEDMRKQLVLGMRVRKTRFRRLGHSRLRFRCGYTQKSDYWTFVHNFRRAH